MRLAKLVSASVFSLAVLVGPAIFSALSSANAVTQSRVDDQRFVIDANALKPAECAVTNLTRIVILARGDKTSNANELVIGTPGDDTISSRGGVDCILGGGGDDDISGGNGLDILMGGPGNDALDGGGGKGDVCYGGGQAGDTFKRCETIVP